MTNATLTQISDVISKVAPFLGKVIPIPGASAILDLVSTVFGADNNDDLLSKISSDPAATNKLAEIESNTKVQLQQILASQFATEVGDKKDARDREVQIRKAGLYDFIPMFLVSSLIITLISSILLMTILHLEQAELQILGNVISMLLTLLAGICGYYFGSSYSGDNKRMQEPRLPNPF